MRLEQGHQIAKDTNMRGRVVDNISDSNMIRMAMRCRRPWVVHQAGPARDASVLAAIV